MQPDDRFDRNERLFGKEGQATLRRATVAVIGVGGLGTHVVQQLSLLGVGGLILIDREELSRCDRNRYVGAWHNDPVPGSVKVALGERLTSLIDPSISVRTVHDSFPAQAALAALLEADFVFGCVDNDGARFVLNEACLAYERPLFDLATDVPEPGRYGGRVVVVWDRDGCLHCRGVLSLDEVRRFLSPQETLENEHAVYGVDRRVLDEAGPSVVSLNGLVASLGVTEFMVAVTGMREPYRHLEYRGHMGIVSRQKDEPAEACYYCNSVRGQGDAAKIERYFARGRRG
jgi:hypothetical protein